MGSKGSSQPQYFPTTQNTNQSTSGSSQSTATTTQSPDPLARLAYEQTLRNANLIAQTPYEPYQGQMVAGFTPDTLAAFQGVRNMQGIQNPYLGQAGNLYQQSTNTWQNPMLPVAQQNYQTSYGFIPNQYMGQVGNYTTNALAAAANPQMQAAQNYYSQGLTEARNAQMPAAQNYFNQAMESAINPQLSAAQNYFNQAMGYSENPELQATRNYFNASLGAAVNPLLGSAQNFAQQAAQASFNPALGQAQDYLAGSLGYIQNPQMGQTQNLSTQAVDLSNIGNFNGQALNRYMNPFQQNVVDATLAQMKQNQDVLQNQNTANAIRQGAFGGSGQFLGQAELGRQQALANAQTLAGLNAQNYQQAMGQYNQQQQQAIQARQQAAQLLGQLGQSQAGLGVQALQQAAQTIGQLGQSQAGLSSQTLANLAQTMGQLGQSQAGLNVNALQQAGQTLGQLGQSQAGLQAGTAAQAAQTLGQLGQSQAALQAGTGTQIGQTLGQLGQSEAATRSAAAQQAAQGLGQLGQSQAALQAGTGMQAAQLYGELGNALANRGVQAYQNAAQNLGQMGQAQQSLGVQALQDAAAGVSGLGKQAQQAALTDAQALSAMGDQQRALQQQQLQNDYNQWLQSKAYPYQQTSYFGGLAGALGPALGSTAQQQQQATSQGTQSGSSIGFQPYQQPQQGGGQIPGLITTGLGLVGKLFGLKDGGRVGYADGGEAENETLGSTIARGPYSSRSVESPVTSRVGLGALMNAMPYAPADDYIGEASKLQRILKPAAEVGRQKLMSELNKALDEIPEFKEYKPKLGSGTMEKYPGYPEYTGQTEGGDWGDVAKSIGELAGSEKFRSGVSETAKSLGSLFSNGGRAGYADGGTPQEQYQRSQQAQQQAQQVMGDYQKYLGRPADQPGFNYWTQQAAQGRTPEQIAASMQTSPERMRNVREAYADYLGRTPDVPGYQFWSDQAKQGMSFGDLQKGIQYSPEAMYRNVLGRAPDTEGLTYWNQQATQGLDPTSMELYFSGSPEARAKDAAAANMPLSGKIEQGWAALDPSAGMNKALAREKMIAPLDRPMSNYDMLLQQAMRQNPGPQLTPEQQGMPAMPGADYYSATRPSYPGTGKRVGSVQNYNLAQSMGMPDTTPGTGTGTEKTPAAGNKSAYDAYILMGFPDETARQLAGYTGSGSTGSGSTTATDEQTKNFVTALYKNYLGRTPNDAEIAEHVKTLQGGKKPAELEAMFQAVPEAQNTQYARDLYQNILGRPADLGGLQSIKEYMSKGVPAQDFVSLLEQSPEYKSVPSAFRGTGPVQGYYTRIGSRVVNPYTGLFNVEYTAPYRGRQVMDFLPRRDGGRIGKAAGGGLSGKGLYDYLMSIGATDKEAAMLTGMAKTESNFNPYVMHDRGTGYGLWGHGKDRWADMQRYTGERKPGWEDQAKFALWELRNSPKVALARQALAKADDARDVAIAGMHFERPAGYTASAPWLGKNWGNRYSNVANLMLGRDIGRGPTLRLGGGEPNEDSLMYKNIATPANSERPRGLIPRLISALAPVSSAEAAPGSVLPRINPNDPSGPLMPEPFSTSASATATLPEPIGRPSAALPRFKSEVEEGFGPLRGEKPADASQLLMASAQRPNMGPEAPTEAPLPPRRPGVISQDGKGDGQKYWGDWRDVEPFKSDPIGGFFDSLMGEKPMADKPGTLDSAYFSPRRKKDEEEFDFGDLFRFADGGAVRYGYAEGGGSEEEEVDPLSELGSAFESGLGGLGDALGGLFGEGREARSAEEAAAVASDRAPRQRGYSPISEGLLAAGLGMLAAPTRNPWQAIGMGGLRGLQVYETASEAERKREEAAAQQETARKAAEKYQRDIAGEAPVSEDTEGAAPKVPAAAPAMEEPVTPAPAAATGVLEPETMDIEADPTLRRLSQQYARIAGIPAPAGMNEIKKSQLSNLRFQIEERRRQLESSVKARKAQVEAEQKTPEAKARSKMLETEQEALAKEYVGVEQAARQADQRMATLSRMKDAVEYGRFSTGSGAEIKLGLEKAVQSVFPKMVDEEAIAMAEQFEKDALQAVTDATGGKLGAGISDSDVRFLSRQQAGLGTSKAGNVRTLDAAIKVEQRKKDIAQFARDYRESHGGILDQGYYKALSDWSEANPLFPKESGKPAASSGRSQYTPEERAKAAEILRRRREGKQ